jgi:Zn-dependent metalloprotease
MQFHRETLHGIVPPYILERLAKSTDPKIRDPALQAIELSASLRATRATLALAPTLLASASPTAGRHRLVYDAKNKHALPGTLVRSEGDPASTDAAVNEAYRHSGTTYDFYKKLFGRNSLDDRGMSLISTVHYGRRFNNAFWDGAQMAYGDGDEIIFRRFTRSLDVVAHELTHGVVTFTSNLEYRDEPGALNEHFADVFGVLTRQWRKRQNVKQGSWLIAEEILVPAPTRRALRDMSAPGTAYQNDPILGDDPQPAHVRDQYHGPADYGGVHINSGIPNHAFYVAAMQIGGHAWVKAGVVWYKTLLALTRTSQFIDCAKTTHTLAGQEFGQGSSVQKAVKLGWDKVGIAV